MDAVNWQHTYDVQNPAIIIHDTTERAIMRLQGVSSDNKVLHQSHHRGFSILHRDRNGKWSCTVYVTARDRAATLEHELKHCAGYTHN